MHARGGASPSGCLLSARTTCSGALATGLSQSEFLVYQEAPHPRVVCQNQRPANHTSKISLNDGALTRPRVGPQALHNVPALRDIASMSRVLQSLGVRVRRDGLGTLLVDAGHLRGVQPAPDAVQQLRASFLVLGPLLARCGEARPAKGFHARRLFRNALFRRRAVG